MGIIKKVVVAGIVITAVTGSLAWLSTARSAAEKTYEIVSESGIADAAYEAVSSYIEENFMDEDGNIVIPAEKIQSVINTLSEYFTVENIQSAFDTVGIGIDVQEVVDGDFSSIEDTIVLSASQFKEFLEELVSAAKDA